MSSIYFYKYANISAYSSTSSTYLLALPFGFAMILLSVRSARSCSKRSWFL